VVGNYKWKRDFYKELINDPINISSIEKIVKKLAEVTQSCEEKFQEMINHHKTKAVLKQYAVFVETVYFDKELAHTLYQDANNLEDESRLFKENQISTGGKRGNRIAPHSHLNQQGSSSTLQDEGSSRPNLLKPTRKRRSVSDLGSEIDPEILMGDGFDDSASNAGAPELKKDYLFRNALKTEKSGSCFRILFVVYVLIGVALIGGSIILSVIHSTKLKANIMNLSIVCVPQVIPTSIIRNVRVMQNWANIFIFKGLEWPNLVNGMPNINRKEYLDDHVQLMKSTEDILDSLIKLGQAIAFDPVTYTEYSKALYKVKIPSTNGSDGYDLNEYSHIKNERDVSIIEITNSLLKYVGLFETNFPKDHMTNIIDGVNITQELQQVRSSLYMNPITSYEFMFLWTNMKDFGAAFEKFCSNYVDKSLQSTNGVIDQSLYYFIAIASGYSVLGLIFLIFVAYETSFLRRLIKLLDKRVAKDVVGKIYQKLTQKTDSEASLESSFISKSTRSSLMIVIVIVLMAITVTLTVGLLFVETYINSKSALFTYTNVGLSSRILYHLEMSSFYLTELWTNFALEGLSFDEQAKYGHPKLNHDNFQTQFQSIIDESNLMAANWNELIYGDYTKPDDDPVIGLYPSLDGKCFVW